jgi:triacylglycerol lipase
MKTKTKTKTKRTVAGGLAAALALVGAACTTAPATGRSSGRTPVVLVHGYIEGTSIWGAMEAGLRAAGYRSGDITNFAYDTTAPGPGSSARTVAARLAATVDTALSFARAHGNPDATKVDLVSHSEGGLVSRYCIELGDCRGKVSHWMSLAGADGGTALGTVPAVLGEGSGDMSLNSAVVVALRQPQNVRAVLDQGIRVEVQWSPGDGVIIPPQNSQWPDPQHPDPPANRKLPATINHLTIFSNAAVIAETAKFLTT